MKNGENLVRNTRPQEFYHDEGFLLSGFLGVPTAVAVKIIFLKIIKIWKSKFLENGENLFKNMGPKEFYHDDNFSPDGFPRVPTVVALAWFLKN